LQHGNLGLFSQFAHSFYLETMGELGVIGLVLLVGWLLLAVVGAIRSARILSDAYVAALASVAIAFFVAAAYDWVWQLSAVAVVGVGSLGVALGTLPSRPSLARRRVGFLRSMLALLAVAAIVPQVVVLAEGIHMNDSRAAAAVGNPTRAEAEALAAKAVEPWATSPYIQLAQLAAGERQYADAHRWIGLAIDRSPQNWVVWYVASEIDKDRGRIRTASREYERARALNPRTFLFQPRATTPYIELAQLAFHEERYAEAHYWIARAIHRSSRNWAAWFIASEIDSKRGRFRAEYREYQRARALNPHASVFQRSK
jgi:tetratricopeptide (TPR) repeat protein